MPVSLTRPLLAVVALGVALGGVVGAASAGERRVSFTAGPSLAHFAPELGRAVGEELARSGAEVDEIAARADELDGERVRLTATIRGQRVAEEGPLEEIDAVAHRLAERLAQAAAPEKRAVVATRAALLPTKAEAKSEARPESKPELKPEPKLEPKPEAKVAEAKAPPKSDGKPADGKETTSKAPDATTPPAPHATTTTTAVATSTTTGAAIVPASAKEPATPKESASASTETPTTSPAAVTATTTTAQPARTAATTHEEDVPMRSGDPYLQQGFVPRRVVVHQVAEIPTAYGAGYSATHALFNYLRTRLRLQVVPGGVGMAPLHIVVDEGMRNAARAVVMARLLAIEAIGMGAIRCRLEIVVVRDGRMVFRRILDAIPSDPNAARRPGDPVFVAVAQALESLTTELDGVLAPIR
jgi:hypothetical protein